MLTKRLLLLLVFSLGFVGLAMDLAFSEPINPYNAPPAIAYGSGIGSDGAFCSAGHSGQ